jgi:hypothetical protein
MPTKRSAKDRAAEQADLGRGLPTPWLRSSAITT